MHSQFFCPVFSLLLTLSLVAQPNAMADTHNPNQRPNIIIMLADDLGWADVGFHGNTEIETPSLDRLAREGVQLDRFYTAPICSPSRSALMTGRDPMVLGTAYGVIMPWNNHAVAGNETFMPQRFKDAGYQTAMIGKWHLGHSQPEHHPNQRGFDHFYGHLHSEVNYFPPFLRQGGIDFQRNGQSIAFPQPSEELAGSEGDGHAQTSAPEENKNEENYETFLLAKEAIEFIESRDRAKPFFLYLPFIAPHTPLQAPAALLKKYENINTHLEPARSADTDNTRTLSKWLLQPSARPAYAAVVDAMDQAIGRVLDALDREEIADNTLVLFMSDNGGAAYSVGGADNYPLRGGKGDTYEGGIRVVATMRWPNILSAGERYDSIITMMDVFPTLASAASIETNAQKELHGRDMWEAVSNNNPVSLDHYVHFVSEIPSKDYYNLTIFNEQWKLVQIVDQKQTEMQVENQLFRISDDPYEHHNLAEQYPLVVTELSKKLNQWRDSSPKNPVRNSLVPPPGWRSPLDWTDYIQADYLPFANDQSQAHEANDQSHAHEPNDTDNGNTGKANGKASSRLPNHLNTECEQYRSETP
ncbi:MAG: arylsulfatase B [Cellvibrionaceae bacterium]